MAKSINWKVSLTIIYVIVVNHSIKEYGNSQRIKIFIHKTKGSTLGQRLLMFFFKKLFSVALWLQKPPKNKIIHRIQRIPIQYVAQNKTWRYKI